MYWILYFLEESKPVMEYFGTPFYLMENPSKSNSDKWPQNKQEVIDGLEGAIRNTKKRIADSKRVNADVSEFEFPDIWHFQSVVIPTFVFNVKMIMSQSVVHRSVQMPYIKQEHRDQLDDSINELARRVVSISKQEEGDGAFAGLLNYSCTRLALEVIRLRFGYIRYWLVATVRGVFKDISGEFYRRLVASYEDKQIEKNGDVDLYKEFLKDIKGQ